MFDQEMVSTEWHLNTEKKSESSILIPIRRRVVREADIQIGGRHKRSGYVQYVPVILDNGWFVIWDDLMYCSVWSTCLMV